MQVTGCHRLGIAPSPQPRCSPCCLGWGCGNLVGLSSTCWPQCRRAHQGTFASSVWHHIQSSQTAKASNKLYVYTLEFYPLLASAWGAHWLSAESTSVPLPVSGPKPMLVYSSSPSVGRRSWGVCPLCNRSLCRWPAEPQDQSNQAAAQLMRNESHLHEFESHSQSQLTMKHVWWSLTKHLFWLLENNI